MSAQFAIDDLRECADALEIDVGPIHFRPPSAGHIVYFVGGETGPVKIGWTQQPIKDRLKCIQNGSPVKLHVLATVSAFRQRERLYHLEFAEARLHGEWFERSPAIEAEIARLRAGHCEPPEPIGFSIHVEPLLGVRS